MRRSLLAGLVLAALLSLVVGASGCAGIEAPAADGATAPATRPRPGLDARLPAGLQTAVFGLG